MAPFFLALVSFLARPKPRIPFLGLSLLRNQTETLATQARLNGSRPKYVCITDPRKETRTCRALGRGSKPLH